MRLEDMDSLFGDASTAAGTPGLRSESDAFMRSGSPVPSLDLRGRPGGIGSGGVPPLDPATGSIPPLDIDPPTVNMIDGRPQYRSSPGPRPGFRSDSRDSRGRVGEWLTRMVGQARGASSSPGRAANNNNGGGSSSGARYAPLDQQQRDD